MQGAARGEFDTLANYETDHEHLENNKNKKRVNNHNKKAKREKKKKKWKLYEAESRGMDW